MTKLGFTYNSLPFDWPGISVKIANEGNAATGPVPAKKTMTEKKETEHRIIYN